MLTAVSSLSPVSTHTRMPARWRAELVSGTSCCSRSSIAVVPRSVNSVSIASAASSSRACRFCSASAAAANVYKDEGKKRAADVRCARAACKHKLKPTAPSTALQHLFPRLIARERELDHGVGQGAQTVLGEGIHMLLGSLDRHCIRRTGPLKDDVVGALAV